MRVTPELLLPFALLVAACGPLPRPFAHEPQATPNELLILPDRVGVIVGRVQGLDPKAASALADALAAALRQSDVIASTRGGNAGSYDVDGHVERDAKMRRLVLDLVRPGGGVVARHVVTMPGDARDIADDGERDWKPVAAAAAQPFAAALLVQSPAELAALQSRAGNPLPQPAGGPSIAIGTVSGAADADGSVLARALAFTLQERSINTADRPGANTHQVRGAVKVTVKPGDQRNLAVVWTVFAPDGKEIGKIEQTNDVPLAMLRAAWSDIALAVAEGAADGIVNVLEEHGILR